MNVSNDFLQNISTTACYSFPQDEDLSGAAIGLLRLQDTYRLDTHDLARGIVMGKKISKELSAHDIFEIARLAYNQEDYYHTILWMQESLEKIKIEDPPTVSESDILEYLALSLYKQDNLKRALQVTDRLYQIAPNHPRAKGNIQRWEDQLAAEGVRRSEMRKGIPPLVNTRPVEDPEGFFDITWLKETEHEVIARINNRLDYMTNLDMDTAEALQVANYGIGGHYEPHYDFTQDDEPAFKNGNRIATVLLYISQPELGAATVFTELKLTNWPKKNDALFWYNLLRSGEGDLRTLHAACPVLLGDKWVSNKWIHEKSQEFRRPCGLKPSTYERYVGDLGAPEPRYHWNIRSA
uniref:procollagen-proline 4-dioxygenase n=1 Tax=Acrobeloides nanus TaxID=290746 RepID=A0A914EE63_9BILA